MCRSLNAFDILVQVDTLDIMAATIKGHYITWYHLPGQLSRWRGFTVCHCGFKNKLYRLENTKKFLKQVNSRLLNFKDHSDLLEYVRCRSKMNLHRNNTVSKQLK